MHQFNGTSCLLALTLALSAAQTNAATISISPQSPTISVGQALALNIDISDVSDLYAYQFDIGFDPSVLSATSTSEGSFLSDGGSTLFISGTIDNNNGTISNSGNALNGLVSGVNGSGTLLTINFNGLAAGSSAINLFNPIFLDSNGADITADYSQITNVSVNAVPVPATFWLLGSGLIGVFGWARRGHLTMQA